MASAACIGSTESKKRAQVFHGLGDIHFVKSLIAFPQRKPNIKIVVINGFDFN